MPGEGVDFLCNMRMKSQSAFVKCKEGVGFLLIFTQNSIQRHGMGFAKWQAAANAVSRLRDEIAMSDSSHPSIDSLNAFLGGHRVQPCAKPSFLKVRNAWLTLQWHPSFASGILSRICNKYDKILDYRGERFDEDDTFALIRTKVGYRRCAQNIQMQLAKLVPSFSSKEVWSWDMEEGRP